MAEIAASVSTRVVSWKEAADSHDSVASDALVMPMSTGRPDAGSPPSATTRRFSASNARALDQRTGQELGRTRLDHRDALEHLPDDHLDVLVVDRDALAAVDLLDLAHQVQLHLARAHDPQHVVRVDRTGDQLLAGLDRVALADEQARHAA